MAAARLDALVAASPENVYYATGYRPWVVSLYRRAGYGASVTPADPERPTGVLVTDVEAGHVERLGEGSLEPVLAHPWWVAYAEVDPISARTDVRRALVEAASGQPSARAGQIDPEAATGRIVDLIREMGLSEGTRLGLETSFWGESERRWLADGLPTVTFVECAPLFAELRMVKSPMEIRWLRAATELTEVGIQAALTDLRAGLTAREIVHRFQRAVLADPRVDAEALEIGLIRLSLRSGPNVLSGEAYGAHPLAPGDVLFLDAGVEVNGYRADMGRTAVFGPVADAHRTIHDALLQGQQTVRPLLRPGTPVSELFRLGLGAVRGAGLSSYVRGNVGHGIGLDPQPELPIVSPEDRHLLEPDMVVSIEFPYYVHGLGAFQVEDTYLIVEDGAEQWTRLPDAIVAC